MSVKSLKRILILFIVNNILSGKECFEFKRKILNCIDNFNIGEGTKVVGPIFCSAHLTIGTNCWVGKNFTINGNGKVFIGDNCDIAPEVIFQTGGHEIGCGLRRAGKGIRYNIIVENGGWIGARSTILGGVHVGRGCVIAACACVCKDVCENTLVGGVPAKTIRSLEE